MNSQKLPEGVKLDQLSGNYSVAASEYSKAFRRAAKLDMVDQTELWAAIASKYPSYQILPDTNHVSYVKNNILASIYTVGKSASLLPTSETDKDIVTQLNIVLENIWAQADVPMFQLRAGERAALMNLGVTQVGWDNDVLSTDPNNFYKGSVVLKNVNPLHYMRDPYSDSLDTASYVITWDKYHKSVILANPNYAEAFQEYLNSSASGAEMSSGQTPEGGTDKLTSESSTKKDYHTIYTHWVRVGSAIHEIHTVDNRYILQVKEDIKPSVFPFAELFCNLPVNNLIGVSEPAKVFANTIAYNLMQSIMLTSEYKNQRPPRFINGQSGLNVQAFTKHGNDADRAFVVNGDASRAVHYHQFPTPTQQALTSMSVLANDIKGVSGVDDRYTGRDTGSILTTGGVENMLAQVTMIDSTKILLYENYSKRLTQLILSNLINHSIKRTYLVADKTGKNYKAVTIDFPSIPNETVFAYQIAISSELPKNKSIIQNMANKMMEMQMQYGAQGMESDLITPAEWLSYQDIPLKEMMLERMNIQRTTNYTETVAQVITAYTDLVKQGVQPDEAMYATADILQQQQTPGAESQYQQQMM